MIDIEITPLENFDVGKVTINCDMDCSDDEYNFDNYNFQYSDSMKDPFMKQMQVEFRDLIKDRFMKGDQFTFVKICGKVDWGATGPWALGSMTAAGNC
jgi:hypothetical protein